MINDLIQTIMGIVGIITIILLWWQIKSEAKWNKINFSIDKINSSLLKTNGEIISDFGIEMEEDTISDNDLKKLFDKQNFEILFKIQEILNMFEDFSTLYNMNMLNKYFAYETYSETIIFYYKKFAKIIDFYRDEYDIFYYHNFEICAKRFIEIKQHELITFNKRAKRFEDLRQKANNKLEKQQKYLKNSVNRSSAF